MRILLVEDNEADARLLREVVADGVTRRLDLHHVASLADAGAALAAGAFDAALLDLSLPDADGMSGLVALQELAPQLPVVVLTGREDPTFAASMVKRGAQDYLPKSDVAARTLERVLRHAVERKRSETELRAASHRLETTVAQLVQQRRSLALLNELSAELQLQTTVADGIERMVPYLEQLLPGSAGHLVAGAEPASASWGTPPPLVDPGLKRVPLRAQGRQVGTLHLEGPVAAELLQTLVRQLGQSLYTIGLHDDLFQQSVRDPLTGIFNRRYLLETVQRELRRAQRAKRPLSLLFLDIDRFKGINDRWGHQTGDAVLVAIAELLVASFRAEDVVSRYGGEEFVIALPDANLQDSYRRSEQLRSAVMQLDFESHQRVGTVTASIGISTFPEHGSDLEALIGAADRALLRAKEAGRNRVVVASAQG